MSACCVTRRRDGQSQVFDETTESEAGDTGVLHGSHCYFLNVVYPVYIFSHIHNQFTLGS